MENIKENKDKLEKSKSIDLSIYEAKQNIVEAVNKSNMPLSILALIVHEILIEINTNLNKIIENERKGN